MMDSTTRALSEGTASAMSAAAKSVPSVPGPPTDLSLADIGGAVLGALKVVGGSSLKVIDFLLKAVTGTSAAGVVGTAKASVLGVIDGAVQTVVGTVNAVGDLTLRETVMLLVQVVVAVAKTLLAVLSALTSFLSGRSLDEWTTLTGEGIERQANELLTAAGAATDDLTAIDEREYVSDECGTHKTVGIDKQ